MEVVLLLLVLLIVCLVSYWYSRPTSNLPGHWSLPVVGHLPFVNLSAPHLTFYEWAERLGPIFKVNMAGQHLVIVNGYEAVREMLISADCQGRPHFFRIKKYSKGAGYGFSNPDDGWKDLRKATFKGIRSYGPGLERMQCILSNISCRAMDEVQENCDKLFDPWSVVYNYMLRSNTAFTLGEQVEPNEEIFSSVAELDKLAMEVLNPAGPAALLDTHSWLRYLGHPTWKKLKRLDAVRDKLWEQVSPDMKKEAASIGYQFWQAQEKNPSIDETRVKCAITDMLIAGTMATTVSVYTMLHVLARLPHLQRHMQRDIDRVLGASTQVCLDDLEEMTYVKATMMELHRYTSMTPLGLPHTTVRPTTIAGCKLDTGVTVLGNLYGVHHDKDFWHDPEAFRPDRFLEDDRKTLLPIDHPNRRRIVAFGYGGRVCPGQNFANARIFMLIASLLKQYTVHKDTVTSPVVPYEPWTFKVGLGMEPQHYKILLSPRKARRTQRTVGAGK